MFENISEALKNKVFNYASGLIITKTKKTCTQLSESLDVSHDQMYAVLAAHKLLLPIFPRELLNLARQFSKQSKGYLVVDDTAIGKRFSKFIEGVVDCYDSCTGQIIQGLSEVVVVWTNDKIMIPLDFELWVSEALCKPGQYKNKYDIALQLIKEITPILNVHGVILDGLYATAYMINQLNLLQVRFHMRFATNRVISAGGIKTSVKKHPLLALIRNANCRTVKAKWQGIDCYITAEKRKDKNGEISIVYIISNYFENPKHHIKIYGFRWTIEKFFRTSKQYLGLKDCQALGSEKQAIHTYMIFFAYANLQIEACRTRKTCVEDVIKVLRKPKSIRSTKRVLFASQFFENFA